MKKDVKTGRSDIMTMAAQQHDTFFKLSPKKPYDIRVGDSAAVLSEFPSGSVNCVVTSPPYWGQREYDASEYIGLEADFDAYLGNLMRVFDQVYRVMADDGSLWLNMGDRYVNKNLVGMPWRVAFALQDRGWILRQDVIWNKLRLTQSAKDRLRTLHEYVFHFVKKPKYYYDSKSILLHHTEKPKKVRGRITSITGVSGVKYVREIKTSEFLTPTEKKNAMDALDETLSLMEEGRIIDFRMYMRGRPRLFNGNSTKLSGRAKEIDAKGYFIKTHSAEGHMPTNIWRMVPEDIHRKDQHCAVYPIGLMEMPVKATCPDGGIVLDPFMGTGTSLISAIKHGRYGVGIDISRTYASVAEKRVAQYLETDEER